MTVPAIVISLRKAEARRNFQKVQLARLGIAFQFMDATTASDIAPEDMHRYCRAWCRPLRPAEVGCALSHRRAWAQISAGTFPVLVLEDDAVLSDKTVSVLNALAGHGGLECVSLETFNQQKRLGRSESLTVNGFALAQIYRDSGGAAAYLLWPEGARKLLSNLSGWLPLADAAINIAPRLRKHQVIPACAIQAMFMVGKLPITAGVYETSLSNDTRPKPENWREWFRYKLRRLRVSIILFRIQLRGLGRTRTTIVPFRSD